MVEGLYYLGEEQSVNKNQTKVKVGTIYCD